VVYDSADNAESLYNGTMLHTIRLQAARAILGFHEDSSCYLHAFGDFDALEGWDPPDYMAEFLPEINSLSAESTGPDFGNEDG